MSAADTRIAQAEKLVEAGDFDGAREIAETVVADDAENAGAHNVLGFIAYGERRLADAQREFELALALGGGDDARENLEAVQRELAAAEPDGAVDFGGRFEDLHAGALGAGLSSQLLGALLADEVDPQLEARLDQLPSAATARERRFLFRFAARFWDGDTDVFENGPLLGSTTRALALGMLANPARRPHALLQTHDWFSSRVPLDVTHDAWAALVNHGLISKSAYDRMRHSGTFKDVFDRLHAGHDYSPLVRSHVGYLPGFPGDVPEHGEAVFEPPEGRSFGLVFVDGCKSWYGTKHWLMRLGDRVGAGAHVVMQDYGWYTCFWLPALVGVLPNHFRLVAYTDETYAFQLVREIEASTLDARFPDDPADLGRDALDDLFTRLRTDAGERNDVHAIVALTIQHAGALAYLGFVDEARERITGMLDRPELAAYRRQFIEPALRSPTYMPDGSSVEL
jgi:hypothetical protein